MFSTEYGMCCDQLTSPVRALTDIMSALVLPVALVPSFIILPILMIYGGIVRRAKDYNEEEKTENEHVL